jgi:uncharacterized protein YwgA
MLTISSKNLLLLVIGVARDQNSVDKGINGITRLQKLLFLLEREGGLEKTESGYKFEPYKAGPYSPVLYDDIEFLENIGLIKSEISGVATEEEVADLEFTFEELMDDKDTNTADAYVEKRFTLTSEGIQKIKSLLESNEYKPVADSIRKIKSKYGNCSLDDLLYYVYTKYPEMTIESEIKDHVLRKGRKR